MASELKPCPLCQYKAHEWIQGNKKMACCDNMDCPCRAIVCTVEQWNTRPAPAATDTGLVTVAWQRNIGGSGVENWVSHFILDLDAALGCPVRELVTRSQAEAVIAAKDATLQDAIDCVKVLTDEKNKLETDNAALTARVKELEADIKTHVDGTTALVNEKVDAEFKAVDLETQLAAANKALETEKALADRLASALEYIDDYSLSYPDLGTVTAVAQPALEAHSAARAVLEGKSS